MNDDRLQQFWTIASRYARVGEIDAFMGTPWGEVVPPPAWSFGDSPEMADELLALVLDGRKTATTGLHQEYIDDGDLLPQRGDLAILLDGGGDPRALIRDKEVLVVPFGEITEKQAAAEGEGDRSLAYWREAHREAFARRGQSITDDDLVVWERFEVLYSRKI